MQIWSKARKKAHKTEDGRVQESFFLYFGARLQEITSKLKTKFRTYTPQTFPPHFNWHVIACQASNHNASDYFKWILNLSFT